MGRDEKVRWGILSTAGIGINHVIPGLLKSPHAEVVAISSRDGGRARAVADRFAIPRAYGSYEALLEDPEIDVVYNPLPNHLHVDFTLAAASKGKHVLCEKPIGITAEDARRLRSVPDGILIGEAFMVRHHPQWKRAREVVRSGELGEIKAIRALFAYHNVEPDNVRNQAEIGGGGLLDIGCYAVTAGRYFFEAAPERALALIDRDPGFGTDRLASVLLDFGRGRQLNFTSATQLVPAQSLEILGPSGRLELEIPFNPPADHHTAIVIDKGESLGGELARREILPACDQYTEQANAFARAIAAQEPLEHDVADAIVNMAVLDAIFASERTNSWASVQS
ncbi:MAG: NAD-binding protein [Pelagibacterium sp.]|nr:NAD-binding protein [Pelagibacterium sp.]